MKSETLSRRSALANGLAMAIASPLTAFPAAALAKHPDAALFALVAKCESARAASEDAWRRICEELDRLPSTPPPEMPAVLRQPIRIDPWPPVFPPLHSRTWTADWLRRKIASGSQVTVGFHDLSFDISITEALMALLTVAENYEADRNDWCAKAEAIEATARPFDDAVSAALRELAACPARTVAGLAAKVDAFAAACLLPATGNSLDSEALSAVLRDIAALAGKDATS